ncbi:RDD family protein [Pseudonocardia sp. CA-107938]|uniref:RDD family protein n=1 Tax=Pseudonocardia sp. CA-107938 TaxID=3240021 RepID=UPI003D8EEA6B
MRDVITGEAVVVELPLAQLASRSLAFGIDAALVLILDVLILLGYAFAGTFDADPAFAAAMVIGTSVLVLVGVPVTVETLSRGRSLGKLIVGLRVVRDDGGPIRFRHALARGLAGLIVDFGVVSGFTGAVALFSSLISPRGKRIGDLLAGTVVVRDRVRTTTRGGIVMPPPLAGWANTVTLSQVPDALALSIRQFLLRAPDMDAQARASMATSFAAEATALVSPAPPPGTPPEAFLAAVLAERSRRETARLNVEQAAAAPVRPPPAPPPPPADGFTLPR